MKPLFAFLLILSIALPAYAHPGKTDRYGGHKCYKECAEWDLYYAEYHLHDKNGRPVKVVKKKPVRPAATGAVAVQDPVAVPPAHAPASPAAFPASRAAMAPDEPDLILPWILLILFLLLFLAVRRRGRNAEDRS